VGITEFVMAVEICGKGSSLSRRSFLRMLWRRPRRKGKPFPYRMSAIGEHGLRFVAVVVSLRNDFAVFELEERGEVGTHLAAGRNGLERDGQHAGPIDFESHLVAAGEGVSDGVGLAAHYFFAALGRRADGCQVAAAAGWKEFAGKDFDNDFGREKLSEFAA
jgi:hypothetical protein